MTTLDDQSKVTAAPEAVTATVTGDSSTLHHIDETSPAGNRRRHLVEVVIPVYNEQHVLAASVRRVNAYLTETFPYPFRITIADNASTDSTWTVARALEVELPRVRAVHLDQKGRGRALRHVWSISDAEVVAYMDVDLSTGLEAFLPLIAPLISGHSDLAIGTRLARGSSVVRGPKREFLSRSYNRLLRTTMAARFSDAQCGFKAGRTEIIQALLPAVEDERWFFDTELLLLAEHTGLRIHEVPVDWVDDPDSRVDVMQTALDDLRGMARFARKALAGAVGVPVPPRIQQARMPAGMSRQLPSFAVIGVISTLASLVLYMGLRTVMPALAANALALLATAIANTAANRRLTFGIRGPNDALRHQIEGGVTFLIGLVLSSSGLVLLHAVNSHPSQLAELMALVSGYAPVIVVRFLLLRNWVFRSRRSAVP